MKVLRLAAFSTDPAGGNPAGVVLDAEGLDDPTMQSIARDVDFAETAFVTDLNGSRLSIRYFSPVAEVPFCGHATIATAIALVEHGRAELGELTFRTPVGVIAIRTESSGDLITASFTSVEPSISSLPDEDLAKILEIIGLSHAELDIRMPPAIAYAGNRHPLIVLADRTPFDNFGFDPSRARALMDEKGWPATIIVLHAPSMSEITARNIFPVGSITEDSATGSAAASVGAYLRTQGLLAPPARISVHQGYHVGRPSVLTVYVPPHGGPTVSGTAVEM